MAPMMEAARTSETLVNFCQTTRRYKPESFHTRRRENLKSNIINIYSDSKLFLWIHVLTVVRDCIKC
jgi:hypothetical protein